MPGLRTDDAGVSEVVGALLLIAVVSSAAFGFGLFLHGQAKATEAQKQAELQRALEKLEVQAIDPVASGADWEDLTFRIASLHLDPSQVVTMRVNGMVVRDVVLDPDGAATPLSFDTADPDYGELHLAARRQVELKLVDVDGGAPFFGAPAPILLTDSVHVEIVTALGNRFERAFIPPSAVILVDQDGSGATGFVLDGSRSVPGSDGAFLVSYAWTVDPAAPDPDDGLPGDPYAYRGRIVHGTVICNSGECTGTQAYTITLVVTDSFGMTGSATYSIVL